MTATTATPAAPRESVRYPFIDAMRGVAAVWVVLFHLYSKNLSPMTGFVMPRPLDDILANGHLGVYVFFVISGFAIAQSLHGKTMTLPFAGRYALRRSIRLDLPYWATMVAMIVLVAINNHSQSQRSMPLPSIGSVATHLVYLHGFFGYPDIVGVFWTLRYEVQFYLALVLLTALAQRVAPLSRWVVFLPCWALALVCATGRLDLSEDVALYCWPYFFLGVVTNWTHHRGVRLGSYLAVMASMLVTLGFVVDNHHYLPHEVGAALVTALAVFAVSRTGRLATLTLGRVLQWLGRISYSLYLVHMLVGTPSMRILVRVLHHTPNLLEATGFMIIGLAVSLGAAQLLYMFVERPSHRLSRRVAA